jgi:SPX domain protein involved in polyphosphate accumulation
MYGPLLLAIVTILNSSFLEQFPLCYRIFYSLIKIIPILPHSQTQVNTILVSSSIISSFLDSTYMYNHMVIDFWVEKENVAHTHNVVLFSDPVLKGSSPTIQLS